MGYCIVAGCKSHKQIKKCRYYSFPRDKVIRKKWVVAVGDRKPFKTDTANVCSEHFVEQDFRLQDILLKVPLEKRRLKNGAIPSQNLPTKNASDEDENKSPKKEKKYVYKEDRIEKLLEECRASAKEELVLFPVKNNKKKRKLDESEDSPADHSYTQNSGFRNSSTQTEIDYECSKEFHIMRLESENKKLVSVIKKQCKRAEENETIRKTLEGIMTTGQISRLISPNSQSKWSAKDIAEARALYLAGPEVYKQLKKKNYPLPGLSTLRGWVGKIDVKPGKLAFVLQLMRKFNSDEQNDRLCALSFGKLKLKNSKGGKFVHVIMAVGLTKTWCHVVYYNFDIPTSSIILTNVIEELNKINYTVIAVVSDFPSVVCEELGVSVDKPYFNNPCDESKSIFYFIDVFQIIRNLWKRFIRQGFLLNTKQISILPIKEMLEVDKFSLPITNEHLSENKCEHQQMNLAIKFFTSLISDSVRTSWYLGGIQTDNAAECADFIEVVSNWFEVLNSKSGSANESAAYGLDLETQTNSLALMSDQIGCLLPARKYITVRNGIHINNNALPLMLEYMSYNYSINQIETKSINHGHLRNFFNDIRLKYGPKTVPTALEFKYRFRCILLNYNVE